VVPAALAEAGTLVVLEKYKVLAVTTCLNTVLVLTLENKLLTVILLVAALAVPG
jgi:hypothetical protein